MGRTFCVSLLCVLCRAGSLSAQGVPLGVELRGYPSGIIPTIRTEWTVSHHLSMTASGGYNFTNRGDFGVHDHESGGGPGAGVTLSHSHDATRPGWQVGVRAEFWSLGIDWRDNNGDRGRTRVWVLQPAARVARAWAVSGSSLRVEASGSLGVETNVRTRGEPVGHGLILLIGVALLSRLH